MTCGEFSTSTTDCNYLVIDAGQVLVESNLVDKATMREIEQKRKHQYTDKDFKKLESLMYDSFTIKLKDAQVGNSKNTFFPVQD